MPIPLRFFLSITEGIERVKVGAMPQVLLNLVFFGYHYLVNYPISRENHEERWPSVAFSPVKTRTGFWRKHMTARPPIVVLPEEHFGPLENQHHIIMPDEFRALGASTYDSLATLQLSQSAASDRMAILTAFAHDVRALDAMSQSLKPFFSAALEINTALQTDAAGNGRDSRAAAFLKERQAKVLDLKLPALQLTPEIVRSPSPELLVRLRNMLAVSVSTLTANLVRTLDLLLTNEEVGLVEWFDDGPYCDCSFHYFKHLVTVKTDSISETRDIQERRQGNTIHRTTTDIVSFHRSKEHLVEEHVHLVVNAERRRIPEVLMPSAAVRLLNHVPDWLAPVLSVITGTLVQKDTIRYSLAQVLDVDVEKRVSETTYDRPRVDPDPALVLGPYVLVGWTDDVVQAELMEARAKRAQELAAQAKRAADQLAADKRRQELAAKQAAAKAPKRQEPSGFVQGMALMAASLTPIWYGFPDCGAGRKITDPRRTGGSTS